MTSTVVPDESSREIPNTPASEVPDKVRGVLLDLDGTLVDAFADIAAAANYIRQLRRLPPLTVDEVKTHVGHGARHLVAGVLELPAGDPLVEEYFQRLVDYYGQNPASEAVPFPGAVHFLETMRQSGVSLGVCTNKPHSVTLGLLQHLNLTHYFGAILGEQPGTPPKPDPAMVIAAMDQLGLKPEATVFVGDSPVDIEVAMASGIACIALCHGAHHRDELQAHQPAAVLDGFDQLSDLLKARV